MWEWLLSPIDATRAHEVGAYISWHGRLMVLAWGVLAPMAVLIARYFKILPGQDWPKQRDSQVWWRSHWIGQSVVVALSFGALALVMPANFTNLGWHGIMGYGLLMIVIIQVLLGVFRGSKGGPTALDKDGTTHGHHYDMTPWRLMFEAVHKTLGYGALALGMATILFGMWKANAPVWMWLVIGSWWIALIALFMLLQKRGMAVDTYQAIWGHDPAHPGNQRPPPGWGVRRPGDKQEEVTDVRSDRGDRVRGHRPQL